MSHFIDIAVSCYFVTVLALEQKRHIAYHGWVQLWPENEYMYQKHFVNPGPLVSPAVVVCGWYKLTPDLDPTPVGVIWFFLLLKYANEPNFTFSGYLTSSLHMTFDLYFWPLTSWTYEGSHMLSKIKFGANRISTCQMRWIYIFMILSQSYNLNSDDLWPWYKTFDHMIIQMVPYCINKPSLVPIGLQLFK